MNILVKKIVLGASLAGAMAATSWCAAGEAGALVPVELRCDGMVNPLGVDALPPRLSWKLESRERNQRQTAYEIVAAGSETELTQDPGDWFDSGKVAGSETVDIPFPGPPLNSSQPVVWKVRVWDRDGKVSDWSRAATLETGLITAADWQAQWLGDGKAVATNGEEFAKDDPAPMFRKDFALEAKVVRARLYICGLGYYEASLNGKRIGDRVLDPGWTQYSARALYSTYDVTDQLQRGTNCLGVMLGNGWYNPYPLRLWGNLNVRDYLPTGRPRFIARLEAELADGTRRVVVSDPSWKTGEGALRFDSIYLGEIYDARRETPGWDRPGFAEAGWHSAVTVDAPTTGLRAEEQPPIRVTETLKPVKLTEPKPGVYIFDLGQNFAGWASLKISAPAGTKIVLRYGELLNQDGTLNPLTSVAGQIKGQRAADGSGAPFTAWQSDTYFARGGGQESYTPRFTFHAFRYVEVTGLPGRPDLGQLTGLRLNAAVERAGEFSCSSDQYNRIQRMCDWTFLSNLFSVQSDCPHRERFSYGGDVAATSEAFMMNYDMGNFYAKAVRDRGDSAQPDGMFTDTAPFVGIQYCGLVWAMAHPLVLRQLYQYYGNRGLVEEQYAAAKKWLELEAAQNPTGIMADGLSDHEGLAPAPPPVMVTPWFSASARTVGELAAILGRQDEAEKYRQLAGRIQKAWLDKFFDPATGKIGPGTQAGEAFGLYLDLVPAAERPAALKYLLAQVNGTNRPHLTTGIFGTKFLLDVLSREGEADLAATLVSQKTYPGWGNMLEHGATTLWEHWAGSDNTYSQNHPMFGSVSQWFYQWVGGIQPAPEAAGFDRIIIRPQPVKDLTWARCSYNSVRGRIVSNWKKQGGRIRLEVEIPANTTAWVYLPADGPELVKERGRPLAAAEGVEFVRMDGGRTVCQIGSGSYVFDMPESNQ